MEELKAEFSCWKSVTTETVAVVTENSNLFLQMALESHTEYVIHEQNLPHVINVAISEAVLYVQYINKYRQVTKVNPYLHHVMQKGYITG